MTHSIASPVRIDDGLSVRLLILKRGNRHVGTFSGKGDGDRTPYP